MVCHIAVPDLSNVVGETLAGWEHGHIHHLDEGFIVNVISINYSLHLGQTEIWRKSWHEACINIDGNAGGGMIVSSAARKQNLYYFTM